MTRPLITPSEAYCIASQWGSYMTSSDPGACFYGFPPSDGRPSSEEHRAECLEYGAQCLAIAKARAAEPIAEEVDDDDPDAESPEQDVCDLEDLLRFFRKTRLRA